VPARRARAAASRSRPTSTKAKARKARTASSRWSEPASSSVVSSATLSCGWPRFRKELASWIIARRRRSPVSPWSSAFRYRGTARSGWPVESSEAARSKIPIPLSGGSSAASCSIRARNSASLRWSSDAQAPKTRCSQSAWFTGTAFQTSTRAVALSLCSPLPDPGGLPVS
jgi:hypothetical protein